MTIHYIDRRNMSEATEYAVAFSAQGGEFGHAFASLIWGDDVLMATMRKGVGFYPDGSTDKISALFGDTGAVLDDTWEAADIVLSVLVNRTPYSLAEEVIRKWEKPQPYFLGFSDCTSFVGEIATAIGLNVPNRLFAPYPIQFVTGLVQDNT